jgi:hypothetical protein
MFEETKSEKFFIPLESPQKSELNKYARDNDESMRTMSRCRHSSVIEDLRNNLQIILVFFLPKEKKVENVKQRTRKKS